MPADFKILTHFNGSYLHLKLEGSFDSVSFQQLTGMLKKYSRKVSTIIIHTNSLKRNVGFDDAGLRDKLSLLKDEPFRFVFTGEHASLFC